MEVEAAVIYIYQVKLMPACSTVFYSARRSIGLIECIYLYAVSKYLFLVFSIYLCHILMHGFYLPSLSR